MNLVSVGRRKHVMFTVWVLLSPQRMLRKLFNNEVLYSAKTELHSCCTLVFLLEEPLLAVVARSKDAVKQTRSFFDTTV